MSELVNARRTSEELSQKLSSTLVDTINRLPNNSAIYRILDDGRSLEPESYSDEFYRMCGYTREDDLFSGDAYGGVHPDDAPGLIPDDVPAIGGLGGRAHHQGDHQAALRADDREPVCAALMPGRPRRG